MRDSGVPSRQERSKLAKAMAKTVQDRMMHWTEDNFGYFEQTMDLVREGAPIQWLRLYMDAVKLGIVRESNINININRQQDRENLQALVRTRIPAQPVSTEPVVNDYRPPSHSSALSGSPAEVYTPFEEIKKEED